MRLFIESLYASTNLPFDLMVFDNNSCVQVQDYLLDLRRHEKIQYLILSEYNLKKLGAMNHLFACAPGDYVAFADSDVYFLPGWLEASLEILKTFPEAGQVSAIPTIDKTHHYVEHTLQGILANKDLSMERGDNLIPEQYVEAHRLSIGQEKGDYMKSVEPRSDIRIIRAGVSAYVSAQDFQFTTRKEVIQKVLPLKVRQKSDYYDPIYSPVFEAKIDELRYWRLSTTKYLIHHIGNHIPDLQTELEGVVDPIIKSNSSRSSEEKSLFPRWRDRILASKPVRSVLKRIYAWTYTLLFERK